LNTTPPPLYGPRDAPAPAPTRYCVRRWPSLVHSETQRASSVDAATIAVEDSLIKANPIRGLWKTVTKGKARNEERELVKAMSAEEAAAFLTAAEASAPADYPYFATLMLAGLRPGEGLALTAAKVNHKGRSILVDCQIGHHGGLKSTKTGGERNVDLSRQLAAVLSAAAQAERPNSTTKVISISGAEEGQRALGPWLFYPELGATPTEKDAQRVYKNALRSMRRCLIAAGLPAHFSLHSLRHTFGSGLVSRGISPVYVQQQMGHASIEQTVGVYGSWFPARVPGAVDTLSEALLGGRGHQMDTLGLPKVALAT
jgi:integrase